MERQDAAQAGDKAQLRQTLFWLSIASAISALLYLIGSVAFASIPMAIMAAVAGMTVALCLLALRARLGRTRPAVYLASGALAIWVMVGGLLAPNLAPAIVLVPILLMALSFPFLDRQMLRLLSVAMLLLTTVLMVLSQYIALVPPIPAPIAKVLTVLFVPVLPVSDDTLVMPLVGALDSLRLLQIQEQALGRLEASGARRLLLDLTGVPEVDVQVAQGLLAIMRAARFLGARISLVGIRPEVARAIVRLGIDVSDIPAYSDLQGALAQQGARG